MLPDAALGELDWVLPLLYLAKYFSDDCCEATGIRLRHIPLLHYIISFLQKLLIRRCRSALLTICLTLEASLCFQFFANNLM